MKKSVSLFLIAAILISVLSFVIGPAFKFSITNDAYCYVNQKYGEHDRQVLDLVVPKAPTSEQGLILYIHGGGWISGDKKAYLDMINHNASVGYISASINYRYADGIQVTCEDILDDIDVALSKIKQICAGYGYDLTKLMVSGLSAGAHLSLMYAYSRADTAPIKPVAVVSCAGPTDLTDTNFYTTSFVDDINNMVYKISGANVTQKPISACTDALLLASPISYVDAKTVPTILCHGVKDDVVPYSNATTLYELLQKYGVESELIIYSNSNHDLKSDPDIASYANQAFYIYAERYLNEKGIPHTDN